MCSVSFVLDVADELLNNMDIRLNTWEQQEHTPLDYDRQHAVDYKQQVVAAYNAAVLVDIRQLHLDDNVRIQIK